LREGLREGVDVIGIFGLDKSPQRRESEGRYPYSSQKLLKATNITKMSLKTM
jgi:hypothetical protein